MMDADLLPRLLSCRQAVYEAGIQIADLHGCSGSDRMYEWLALISIYLIDDLVLSLALHLLNA